MALGIGVSAQGSVFLDVFASTSAVTTQATGSTFIILATDVDSTTAFSTPTDNKGNTYPAVPNVIGALNGSTAACAVWVCQNGVGGAGHVFTANWAGTTLGLVFAVEITSTGGNYGVVDQKDHSDNLSNITTANSPTITTTANGEVIISFLGGVTPGTNITLTDPTGYNNILQANGNGAATANTVGAVGGFLQTTAGATFDIFTATGDTPSVATISISFMPFGGGPPPPVPPRGPMPRQLYVMP